MFQARRVVCIKEYSIYSHIFPESKPRTGLKQSSQKAKQGLGYLTEQRQMLIWGIIRPVRGDFAKSSLAKGMKLLGVHDSTAKFLTVSGVIHGPISMNTRSQTKKFIDASGTPPNRHCKWS